MTMGFKLRLAWIYICGFLTGGTPIYYRDNSNKETYIKLAKWKYDPWTDTKTFVTKHHGERILQSDGSVDNYGSVKWRYVNKSLRTLQNLQHS